VTGSRCVQYRLGMITAADETRELIIDAWRMVVPKKVAAAQLAAEDARNVGR
jgi:hypothetical protein